MEREPCELNGPRALGVLANVCAGHGHATGTHARGKKATPSIQCTSSPLHHGRRRCRRHSPSQGLRELLGLLRASSCTFGGTCHRIFNRIFASMRRMAAKLDWIFTERMRGTHGCSVRRVRERERASWSMPSFPAKIHFSLSLSRVRERETLLSLSLSLQSSNTTIN